MMRVAMISEHASPAALLGGEDAGGQNVYVDEVSRALANFGFHVDVFTRRDNDAVPEVEVWSDGVRIVNLAAGPAKPIRKDDIWPYMPAMRDQLLRFSMRSGAQYDLVHGNFWMSGWIAAELRKRRRIPAVQLFHALGTMKRSFQGASDTSPSERIAAEQAIVQDVDRVIATCPDELRQLQTKYMASADRVEMIPLGVDATAFKPVDQQEARARIGLGLEPDDRVIVYVGRMVPRKGIRNVVKALASLLQRSNHLDRRGRIKVLIVGGETEQPDPVKTPEIGEIQRLAVELGVADRVILTGKRARVELPDYYCAGDVAVTTPWYEPFGLTPLEAMACARPVIGSKVGGIAFTVRHGVTGLLVPPETPDELAAAMEELLADRETARRMGEAGRRRVEEAFTWQRVACRTADLYRRMYEEANMDRRLRRASAGG
jgi:D-inositol-3-phosphate glycosyltransferase